MSLSTLKILYVNVDDFVTIDNIGHGMCLAFAFFQGYNFGRNLGRCVEADLRHQISQAMIDLIRITKKTSPSKYSLTEKSASVIKDWEAANSPYNIIEEATSLPNGQYWNAEILEFYIEHCLSACAELYYFKMV